MEILKFYESLNMLMNFKQPLVFVNVLYYIPKIANYWCYGCRNSSTRVVMVTGQDLSHVADKDLTKD